MHLDVLVTDGNFKHTYAILRALNEKKLKVGIISNTRFSLSFFSKYVAKRFLIKTNIDALNTEESFKYYKIELIKILSKNKVDLLMPVGNVSFYFCSVHSKEIQKHTKIIIADSSIMKIAQNKKHTFLFAEKHGIRIPKTYFPENIEELQQISGVIKYPCVIKKTNYYDSGVIYCNTQKELLHSFQITNQFNNEEYTAPIIQEYIVGKGYGFYSLFNNGKCVAFFMHERIHEFPITGGSSTLAKSFYDEDLLKAGIAILEKLNWHGVSMIEFKKDDHDNSFKLIEINPKFWGSLELSHKCGINFPYLMFLLGTNHPIPDSNYEKDIYFRWTFPHDIIWYFHASKAQKEDYIKLKKKVKIYNNIHFDDPMTVIYNVLFTIYKIFMEKKYPHGLVNK